MDSIIRFFYRKDGKEHAAGECHLPMTLKGG